MGALALRIEAVLRSGACRAGGLIALVVLGWSLMSAGVVAKAAAASEPASATPPLRHYEQAELSLAPLPAMASAQQEQAQVNQLRPAADALWQTVDLPDRKLRRDRVMAAPGEVAQMRWYRLRYTRPGAAPDAGSAPLGLYVPRVVSGPLSVLLRMDTPGGPPWHVLYQSNERWLEEWNRPLLVELPPEAGPEIEIVLGCSGLVESSRHALSTLWIGPLDTLTGRAHWRQLFQLQAPMATSCAVLIVGLFAFGVWWRRRNETAYLYFALAAAVWCWRNLHYYIDLPREDLANAWFWWATNASLSWAMWLVYRFALRFDARAHRGVEWGLSGVVLGSSVLTLPILPFAGVGLLVQHAVNALAALGVTLYMATLCWRGAGAEVRAITAASVLSLAFGVNDLLLLAGRMHPETVYLLPYAPLVVLGSFVYAMLRRYVQAIEQVEGANEQLEASLREREAELQAKHAQLLSIEREQAQLRERQRLMADMHDGLGSTLTGALIALEQGQMDSAGAATLLRECVDDLRLVIDSLEPVENDLGLLLATLRHRLGRRLEAAGVTLEWQMAELPRLPWLSPPDALQVLRLVQEVLGNVLKHAGAQRVQMALLSADAQTVELRIEDDGCGFDPQAAGGAAGGGGRGLNNLRLRARQLQARLLLESAPGRGTRVRLLLPVQRG